MQEPFGSRGSTPGPYSAPTDTLGGGERAGCPLLKNPVPIFDHSVKRVNESFPALLEKSENLMLWKVTCDRKIEQKQQQQNGIGSQ